MTDLRTARTYGPPTESRLNRIEDRTSKLVRDLNEKANRSGQWAERRASSTYTAKPWDLILADPSGAAFTILLPDPSKCVGSEVKVKNVTSSVNPISVAALAKTVDGFVVAMTTAYGQKTFRAARDGWWSV